MTEDPQDHNELDRPDPQTLELQSFPDSFYLIQVILFFLGLILGIFAAKGLDVLFKLEISLFDGALLGAIFGVLLTIVHKKRHTKP